LDNWGDGVDELNSRWVLRPEGWECLETRETAREVPPQERWRFITAVLVLGMIGVAVIVFALALIARSR